MMVLTEKQRKLAEENHGLIISFIRRNHLNFEEVYGDLAETYCLAIALYNESISKLSTYIFASLENKMKNTYRMKAFAKTIPTELIVSMDAPISTVEGSSTYAELIPDRGMSVESEVQYRMGWEQIFKEFTPFELEILNNLIFKDHKQEFLAEKHGISQSAISRWERAIKEKVRQILFGAPE